MKTQWIEMTCEVEVGEGEMLVLPESVARSAGPGRWIITVQPADRAQKARLVRDHSAFLTSYAPQDEGLYDDAATG